MLNKTEISSRVSRELHELGSLYTTSEEQEKLVEEIKERILKLLNYDPT